MTAPMTNMGSTPRPTSNDPALQYAQKGVDMYGQAVSHYGDLIRPEFLQTIGTALGGLNGIGALRSGASTVALNDIGTQYTDRIAEFAATQASQGAELGLKAYDYHQQDLERKRQAHASFLRTLGSVLGAGVGFIAGGPVGAGVGSQAGGSVGGTL